MAEINQLVERIVRILKKNDGLTGLFFKDLGEIYIHNLESEKLESIKYDPSDIEDFFDAYESAVERRALLGAARDFNGYVKKDGYRIEK